MLTKPDGSRNTKIDENIQTIMDHLIPENCTQDDTIQHKNARGLSIQPIDTLNDQDLFLDEVRQTLEGFNTRKASEPDGFKEKS